MDGMCPTTLTNPSDRTEMPNRKRVEKYRHLETDRDQGEIVRAKIPVHEEIRALQVVHRSNIHNQVEINSELAMLMEHHIDFGLSN